jgi:hypothetical protein
MGLRDLRRNTVIDAARMALPSAQLRECVVGYCPSSSRTGAIFNFILAGDGGTQSGPPRSVVVTDRHLVVLALANPFNPFPASVLEQVPIQPVQAVHSRGTLTVTIGSEQVRLSHNEFARLQAAIAPPSA